MKRFVQLLVALGVATAAGFFVYRRFCRGEHGSEDVTAKNMALATPEEMLASADIPEWPADDEVEEPIPVG
jgi:hypothetical protein